MYLHQVEDDLEIIVFQVFSPVVSFALKIQHSEFPNLTFRDTKIVAAIRLYRDWLKKVSSYGFQHFKHFKSWDMCLCAYTRARELRESAFIAKISDGLAY